MSSNSKPNGTSTNGQNNSSIHQDISHVADVLAQANLSSSSNSDSTGSETEDLALLLKQIDGANGVLNGVEDKLDGLLNDLDTLLAALESKEGGGEKESAASETSGAASSVEESTGKDEKGKS